MQITTQEIFEEFEDLDPRDQSQYLLELGYDLPDFSDAEKRDEDLVHGCQSQVWLRASAVDDSDDPVIQIVADSDAQIVRGLIKILLAAYSDRTASEIVAFKITDVFDRLNLRHYISPQRRNGLQGMVDRIRELSAQHCAGDDCKRQNTEQVAVRVPRSAGQHLDVEAVRAQFPILNQTLEGGLRPVFLDSGASAQKPQVVIDKEREVEEQYFSNAYRGRHSFGARVDAELETSRQAIANFINAESAAQVCFTPGTTAAINMVAFGWGRSRVKPGDEILITQMEHHANFVPWQQLARQTGATLRFIPLTDDGQLDMNQLQTVLNKNTKVVSVTGTSNVLGTVNPIGELARRAHDVGAVIAVDGAQSVPHAATDVIADDVDFLVFSGHKVYGPTGVGILYGKAERLQETEPILFGGHMIDQVFADDSTWAEAPAKFEAGTLPIIQAIALGAAIQWMSDLGMNSIHNHEQQLLKSATEQLMRIPGMKIYGPPLEHKGAIISFRIDRIHPEDLAALLDHKAVMTRHGHHCTMPLHKLLGVSGTTRISFGVYNNEADISAVVDAIQYARASLKLV